MDNPSLEIQNISHRFGYYFAIKKLSFKAYAGSVTGLVGGNGAGKTTLIRILAGILSPSQGSLFIGGKSYSDNSTEIKQISTVLLDDTFLFSDLTVFENLVYYANLFGYFNKRELAGRIHELAAKFQVPQWLDVPFRILSKGLQHRIDIIRCLLTNPKFVYLDEPDAHLDFQSIRILNEAIIDLKNDNATIILATHNIELATQLCDQLLIMKQGRLNLLIEKAEYSQKNLREYY